MCSEWWFEWRQLTAVRDSEDDINVYCLGRYSWGVIIIDLTLTQPWPNPNPTLTLTLTLDLTLTLTLTLLKRNVRCKEWHDVIRRTEEDKSKFCVFCTAFPAHACTGQYWRNRRKLFLEQLRIQHIIYWSRWSFLLRPTVNCGASRLAESDAVPRLVPVEPVVFLRGCFMLCYVASTEEKLCSF